MKIGNLTVGVHNTSERSDTEMEKKTRVSKEIGRGKKQAEKQSKGILEFNIGRQYWKTGRQLGQLLEY